MKNLFSSLLLVIAGTNAFADVLPPDHHNVNLCAKIVYPSAEVMLVGVIKSPMASENKNIVIKQNECVNGGYKFNNLNIYSVSRQTFSTLADIARVDIASNPSFKLESANFEFWGGTASNVESSVKDLTEIYRIYQFTKDNNGEYKLYLDTESKKYRAPWLEW